MSFVDAYVWIRVVFFFRQNTAYEMRISDWSSDVCSSDLCPSRVIPSSTSARATFCSILRPGLATLRFRSTLVPAPASAAIGRKAISPDRKSVVQGKSVSVRVDLGGSRIINKNKDTEADRILTNEQQTMTKSRQKTQ